MAWKCYKYIKVLREHKPSHKCHSKLHACRQGLYAWTAPNHTTIAGRQTVLTSLFVAAFVNMLYFFDLKVGNECTPVILQRRLASFCVLIRHSLKTL